MTARILALIVEALRSTCSRFTVTALVAHQFL